MNFFEHQDQAHKKTVQLVFFFIVAVICLIVLTNLFVIGFLAFFNSVPVTSLGDLISFLPWKTVAVVTLTILGIVVVASLYKLNQLVAGGKVITEAMGGRLINIGELDEDERKTLNIVEEIAIASGTPVPPVYVIEEAGINAFAAGYKPSDAVIGITRGCINQLTRDELQGIIAHEFSHILNGDMRLNMRLIGILHGILVIGVIGAHILRSASSSSRSGSGKSSTSWPLVVLGGGLVLIGYPGTFFGNLIKASVSRQREFLADMSAVQFTRNPDGISGALKKIGGYSASSLIKHPYSSEISHLFFGQAVQPLFNALTATHPPLNKRIKRVDPQWDGVFPQITSISAGHKYDEVYSHADTGLGRSPGARPDLSSSGYSHTISPKIFMTDMVESIGAPTCDHREFAQAFLSNLPVRIKKAVYEPYGARALVFCLLLDRDKEIRDKQRQLLREHADLSVVSLMDDLSDALARYITEEYRLVVLELCLPALRQLSDEQWYAFKKNLKLIMKADGGVQIFEWALYRIILHYLKPTVHKFGEKDSISSVHEVPKAVSLLLSAVAASGVKGRREAWESFNAARKYLALNKLSYRAPHSYQLRELTRALKQLNHLKPLAKPELLKAMCLCTTHDSEIRPAEVEMIRAISASLDCPVPPLTLDLERE